MSETQTTKLGRNWLLKTLLFTTLLVGFGCWGLADALYFYPKRGELVAARMLKDHLVAADAVGKLTTSQLTVADPVQAYTQLRAKESELVRRSAGETPDAKDANFEFTRLKWLDALNKMWALRAEPRLVEAEKGPPPRKHYFDMREGQGYTLAADGGRTDLPPQQLLTRLVNAAGTTNQASPLSGFDMLFQWVFVVIGFGGGLWMIATFIRAAGKKYSWIPATQQLTLHDGKTITPDDLREVDKRLWHKFFVTLGLKDGSAYKLDLLRYQPLEDWILTMERTAFPESETPEGGEPASPESSGTNQPHTPSAA